MAAPLKHQNNHEKISSIAKTTESKFKEYNTINPNANKLKDSVFFCRILSFAICTVLSCLMLLTANLTPIFAFPVGMVLGSLLTAVLHFLIDLLKR